LSHGGFISAAEAGKLAGQEDEMNTKPPLSTGMFYMWRCLIAVAHADGRMGMEELDRLEKIFDNLLAYFNLTEEQRHTFAYDLHQPRDIDALFSRVNEPEARDMLFGFAEEMAWADGVLDAGEEEVLRRLRLKNPENFDREELRREIRADIERHKTEWNAERAAMRQTARGRNPFFYAVDVILTKMGIDILDS